jgi:hypothetical protein
VPRPLRTSGAFAVARPRRHSDPGRCRCDSSCHVSRQSCRGREAPGGRKSAPGPLRLAPRCRRRRGAPGGSRRARHAEFRLQTIPPPPPLRAGRCATQDCR